jgi:hypothetical protein
MSPLGTLVAGLLAGSRGAIVTASAKLLGQVLELEPVRIVVRVDVALAVAAGL